MLYEETDIVFSRISGEEFEELCFDLLVRTGFTDLVWRRGGADGGRDIEASFAAINPVAGTYQERWFVECKNHVHGLNVSDLDSKVAWARARKPDHLLIISSSYLTKDARSWVEEIQNDLPARIHLLEGKQLKAVLLRYPEFISRYLLDSGFKLLQDVIRQWCVHDVLPSPHTLFRIHQSLDPRKLEPCEVGFLWNAFFLQVDQIAEWISDNEVFSFEFLFDYLTGLDSPEESLLENLRTQDFEFSSAGSADWLLTHARYLNLKIHVDRDGVPVPAMYTFVHEGPERDSRGVEVLVEGGKNLQCRVQRFEHNSVSGYRAAAQALVRVVDGRRSEDG